MPLEFPALTVPVLLKTGGSFARASSVTSARTCSSFSRRVTLPFLSRTVDRNDFGFETALGGGASRALVAFKREGVLLFPRNLVLLGEHLGRFAHDQLRNRADESVAIHSVDQRLIAELESPAALDQVRHAAHRFRAARDDDLSAARENFLPAEHDRAQSRRARHVHRERGHVVAKPRAPGDLPRGIRAHASRSGVAENHFVDVPRYAVRGAGVRRAIGSGSLIEGGAENSPGVRSGGSGNPKARSSTARTAIVPRSGCVKSASIPPNLPIGVRTALTM